MQGVTQYHLFPKQRRGGEEEEKSRFPVSDKSELMLQSFQEAHSNLQQRSRASMACKTAACTRTSCVFACFCPVIIYYNFKELPKEEKYCQINTSSPGRIREKTENRTRLLFRSFSSQRGFQDLPFDLAKKENMRHNNKGLGKHQHLTKSFYPKASF